MDSLFAMAITAKQKRYLRGLAHGRKVVVTVGGKGLSDSLLMELHAALDHHELLKIKLPALPKTERDRLLRSISAATDSEVIQAIGHTGVIFRAAAPAGIDLPA